MRNWRENWELKLLALIMATLVWIFVKLGGGRMLPSMIASYQGGPRAAEAVR
jgi:hypothetical protein